jgi:hypothetical protein
MAANPIPGPYTYTQKPYGTDIGNYTKVIKASATFYATGSNAYPAAFYISGSAGAAVTLTNGEQIAFPAPAATAPAQIFEMAVYSVDSGTVYLLYR